MSAAASKHSALAAASLVALAILAVASSAGGSPPNDRDQEPPSSPSQVRVTTATTSSVTVEWAVSTDNVTVMGYEVAGEPKPGREKDVRVREPKFIADRLGCGVSLALRIAAFDRAGNRSLPAQATVSTAACTDTTAPTPPSGFRQAATGEDAVVLVWDSSTDDTGVVGYGVYRDGFPSTTAAEPSATISGLSCGKVYQVEVDAFDAAGNRSSRQPTWVQTAACPASPAPPPPPSGDTTPPSQPTSLAASSVTQTSVTLTWGASTDNVGVTGYGVYRNSSLVATVSQTGASVSGLACGTAYTFAVDAYDAAGNRSSKASLTTTTAACSSSPPPPSGDTTPPSQPTALDVASATQTSVTLSWGASTDNVGVTGYGVYRDSSLVTTVSQPGASVSGLSCGRSYTFAVDAYDAAGNRSTKASLVAATAACPDLQAPTAPANLQTTSRTATSIALSWSASSDNVAVVGYGLYRGGSRVGTTSTTSGIFSGLTCNTNYTLGVDAYDAAGNRSSTTTVMVATTACPDTSPPSAPTGLTTSNVSQTGLTLSWNASTDNVGVAGYDVYRGTTKVGSPSTRSFGFTGLTCGTTYTLGVVAFDAAGNRSGQSTTSASTSACSTSGTQWTFCASENQRCSFTGTKEVRYGANSTWTTPRTFTEGVDCTNQVFGDPLVGVVKGCEARSATSSPAPPSGSYPSSYYTGPLGQSNILPTKAGAFLIVWPDGVGWSAQQARIADLETRTGRRFDGIGTHYGGGGAYQGYSNCMYNSGERREQWIHDRGSYPLVSWSPDGSLSDVNSGAKDGCLRAVADYFKSFSFRIMLRMWWEFNGNWMGWSGCGQTFIDAWRRVVGIFKERGATNVGFWWSPQEGFDRACSANSYPGDQYVDWVGSDAYNWCYVGESSCWSSPLHSGWAEFGEIFDYGSSSAHDTFGSRKPFVAGEANTVYDPNNPSKKGQWYRNVPAAARLMEHLVGIQFFEVNVTAYEGPKSNWPVDYPRTDASVFDGFVALAKDPYFNTR